MAVTSHHDALAAALSVATGRAVEIGPDTDLIADGILDSLEAIQFLLELEEKTGVRFDAIDLAKDGLSKVGVLLSYLESQGAGRRG